MTTHFLTPRLLGTALLALSAALLGAPAMAAGKTAPQSAHARYLQQRAQCPPQRDSSARDDCLSQASTTYAATQPSLPGDDAASLQRNKLLRCAPLRGADQLDCQARMRGEGTMTGSVAGGGIYRELVTIVTGEPVDSPSQPAIAPAPAKRP